jgi:predicted SAM-dependent methyltransferase
LTKIPNQKILDLGCGDNKVPDSIGLDNISLQGVDVVHDLLNFPYPFDNESFDKIYLRHVIEHFSIEEINQIFREVDRILKKEGDISITVPHVFSISAFIDPTHKSFYTFGSGHFWDRDNPKSYYKSFSMDWKLLKTSCNVIWFDWKSFQLKRLDKFLSNIVKQRLNKAIQSIKNPCKADRIVKKSAFHFVEIEWNFKK